MRASHLDTDDDGLLDHWETRGIDMDGDGGVDLDLAALGANSLHKDIFLEIDWLAPRTSGWVEPWSNELQPGVTQRLAEMFAFAPVDNPDSSTGIVLHVDAGPGEDAVTGMPVSRNFPEGSVLQGGDEVHPPGLPGQHIDAVLRTGQIAPPGVVAAQFSDLKDFFFGTQDKRARELAFHYTIAADYAFFVESGGKPYVGKILEVGVTPNGQSFLRAAPDPPSELEHRRLVLTSGASAGQMRPIAEQLSSELVLATLDGSTAWNPVPGDTFAILKGNGGVGEIAFLSSDATLPGNDFIMSLGSFGVHNGRLASWFDEWMTLAHELGHNLGLQHCGVSSDAEDCDDVATGVTVLGTGHPAVVSESGLTFPLQVLLNSQPSSPVDIEFSGAFGEIKTIPGRVTFTPADWNVRKTIEVHAVDDDIVNPIAANAEEGSGGYHVDGLELVVTSDDRYFDGVETGRATVNIYDDERPGLIPLVPKRDQVVEGGPGLEYKILLTGPPRSPVSVALTAPPPVVPSPSTFVFSPADWNVPRTVTLTAAPDGVEDEIVPIVRHSLSSADASFNGVGLNVGFDFKDREGKPRVVFTEADGKTEVFEGGAGDTVSVSLAGPPSSTVKVSLEAENGEILVSPDHLDFGPTDWNVAKPVAIEAIDDSRVAEGVHWDLLTAAPDGGIKESLTVFVWDNDFALEPDHRSLMSYAHNYGSESDTRP